MNNILPHPGQFALQHVTYTARQDDGSPRPFVQYRVRTRECKVHDGVTDKHDITQAIPTRYPDEMDIGFPNSIDEKGQPA
ncbi:hypothetical protein [Pseudomonas citronellolis]|uniref:hypothetical protein n=1 Tax=Pseudomonas citronellolis TaxID=53408 RepID=UPI0023E3D13B|nr:hypothetical protein [Pseudomonas citronellolis]MDF3935944.1 hypothetical protein [Pseudomonas citronellolis]